MTQHVFFEVGEVVIYAVAINPEMQPYVGSEVTVELANEKAFNADGNEETADYVVSGLPAPSWGNDPRGWLGVHWYQLVKKPSKEEPESIARRKEVEV
jgi:hypothetical protein